MKKVNNFLDFFVFLVYIGLAMKNIIKNIIFSAEQDGIKRVKIDMYYPDCRYRGFLSTGFSMTYQIHALEELLERLFVHKEYTRGLELKSDGTSSYAIFFRMNDQHWAKIKTKTFFNILEDYLENFAKTELVF